MISVLASAPSLAERAIGVVEQGHRENAWHSRACYWGYWEREDSKQPVCRTNEAQGSLREETRWRRLW